jgi:phospholipase C
MLSCWGRRLVLGVLTALPILAEPAAPARAQPAPPASPIQHLVVLFPENESFDHYFGTYPVAANPPGEPAFQAAPGTPSVNGLSGPLLTANPNARAPFRLGRSQAYVCDQSANYAHEQRAYNQGLVNYFVEPLAGGPKNTDAEQDAGLRKAGAFCASDDTGTYYTVMGYFDGNTVTALWNYAQHFAMSDNSFGTTFGQSTLGALHLVTADTTGVLCGPPKGVYGEVPLCGDRGAPPADSTATPAPRGPNDGTVVGDVDPYWDVCANPDAANTLALEGPTIGDRLSAAGVSWGWFQGGFALNPATGRCDQAHALEAFDRATGSDPSQDPAVQPDYIPHHEPFQYYASTANPQHVPPASLEEVGHDGQANHQYDLSIFWQAAEAGKLPTVAFLKPPGYQDGHPGRSDALDEQQFLVETVNRLQALPEWPSTAVIIAYDDSDGWYDHVMPPIISHSDTPLDTGCGGDPPGPPARCGYGPRLPLLVISPYARRNYVSHVLSDQASITRFIEDRWLEGQRLTDISFDNEAGSLLDLFDFQAPAAPRLFLDPATGLVR